MPKRKHEKKFVSADTDGVVLVIKYMALETVHFRYISIAFWVFSCVYNLCESD